MSISVAVTKRIHFRFSKPLLQASAAKPFGSEAKRLRVAGPPAIDRSQLCLLSMIRIASRRGCGALALPQNVIECARVHMRLCQQPLKLDVSRFAGT